MSLAPRIDRIDKNYIINGNFSFWQRATSSTGSSGYFTADRWKQFHSGGSLNTFLRATDAPTNRGSIYSLQYSLTPGGPTSSGDMMHYVESTYAKTLVGKSMSLRIWYKTTKATTIRVQFDYPSVADNYSSSSTYQNATYTIVNDGTWRALDVENITVPSGVVNGTFLFIRMSGWVDTSAGSTCNIGDVCLVEGPKAQDFSYAGGNIFQESSLCNRYYRKYVASGSSFCTLPTGMAVTSTAVQFAVPLDAPMRTNPIVSQSGTFSLFRGDGTNTGTTSAWTTRNNSDSQLIIEATTAGATGGAAYTLYSGAQTLEISSEI